MDAPYSILIKMNYDCIIREMGFHRAPKTVNPCENEIMLMGVAADASRILARDFSMINRFFSPLSRFRKPIVVELGHATQRNC